MKTNTNCSSYKESVQRSLDTISHQLESQSEASTNEAHSFKNTHLTSLLLNSFLWILLFCFIIFQISFSFRFGRQQINPNLFIFWICLAVIYLFYVIEILTSSTFRILLRKKNFSRIEEHINKIQSTDPEIKFVSQSYHFSNENGSQKQEKQQKSRRIISRNKKIMTTAAMNNFEFDWVQDSSDNFLENYLQFDLILFKFESQIVYGDQFTENQYFQKLEEFKFANRDSDVHYKVQEIKHIKGFQEKVVGFNDQNTSFCFSALFYLFVSMFLLSSWPYRVWMQGKIAKAHFLFNKTIYCDPRNK